MNRSKSMRPTSQGKAFARPLRVLVLEHSQSDAELCLQELKWAGFKVCADVVQTPEEFAQRLQATGYDIILADYRLPNWTGLEALRLLRQMNLDIPFLLVTGTLGEEAAVECIKQGVTEYVLKDRMARLPVAVHRALEEKALREERVRAERALRDSEASFRLLFANNPLPMWVFDLKSLQILQVNDAAVAHYGYTRQEFLRMLMTDFRPPEDIPRLLEHLCQELPVMRFAGQWRHRTKDGRILDVEISAHGLELAGRAAVLAVGQDITERKRAEEALRESEARYRELIYNATYGIYRTDAEGKLLDVNPALVAMLGYASAEALLALNLATDVYRDPAARARLLEQATARGRVEGQEVEWTRKDGSTIVVRLSGQAVWNSQGGLTGFEGIAEDVTERHTLEKQLRQVQKFEAIGQLAGGIAHDFNNVIGAILGWAEMGQEQTPEGSWLHSHFQKIKQQADRAAGLTRQLLSFARRRILEPQNIGLNQCIVGPLSLLENMIGKDIELKTVLASNLGVVRADPTQIEQVLMNLCLNARDAMPRGGQLLIETKNVEIDEEYRRSHAYVRTGRYVLLAVTDNGVGMDAATLEHIFEPFFTTKEVGKGTGLGLATVYGIVKQHNGFIHVYSEPGHGSTFRIYLPIVEQAPVPQESEERPLTETVRGGTETILVAEDHDGVREMARTALEALGYRVVLAGDGKEAIELFEMHRDVVGLVLLDVVMPRRSGPEVYASVRALRPEVAVLFTTGYSAEAASLEAIVQKDAAILQKPYSRALLARKVRELLDRAASITPAPAHPLPRES